MHQDVITLPKFISKVPRLLSNLPGTVKGLKLGNITDPTVPVGIGREIERATRENPNGIAVIADGRQITYRELNSWANRYAHLMQSEGVQKGDCVAIFIENRPELLAAILGTAKTGAICGLLNTSQRGKVLVHSFNLVSPKMAIVGNELVEAFNEVRSDLKIEDSGLFYVADQDTLSDYGSAPDGYRNLAEECSQQRSDNPDSTNKVYVEDPCFYIYTSGTTGLPKAVIFNHGRWMKAYGGFGFGIVRLKPHDRMYCSLPFYHATGLVICWGSVIAGNATLILERKFSASRFWDICRENGATAFGYVGELCRYLNEQPASAKDKDNKVTKIVGNGMRPNVWKEFKKRFGIKEVLELYASSEGNVAFTNTFNFDNTVGISPTPYAIVQYDKEAEAPVRGSDGYMKKVERGEAGLLIGKITDKSPFHGYTDKDKTESCILRDVFEKGDAYFDTGDMMRDLGFRHAQFVDRLGDTFRWKGENVSTTEVENILDGAEHVSETVVYGVEIPNTNGRAGMASIRLDQGEEAFDFSALVSFLKKELPAYAVPVFLRMSEHMDTTGTFKHQKFKLKQEGFDLSKQDNSVYVLLPGSDSYEKLTAEIQSNIEAGQYRF